MPSVVTRLPAVPALFSSRHAGFALKIERALGRFGEATYRFEIEHEGLTLHASRADFRSAGAADRAARQFVDDALGGFDRARSGRCRVA